MGRWAQRQRASSQGQPSGAVPSVVSAEDQGGGSILVTFSRPVDIDFSFTSDQVSLQLDGVQVQVDAAAPFGANSVSIQQGLDPSAGATFVLVSQPSWLLTRVATQQPTLIT